MSHSTSPPSPLPRHPHHRLLRTSIFWILTLPASCRPLAPRCPSLQVLLLVPTYLRRPHRSPRPVRRRPPRRSARHARPRPSRRPSRHARSRQPRRPPRYARPRSSPRRPTRHAWPRSPPRRPLRLAQLRPPRRPPHLVRRHLTRPLGFHHARLTPLDVSSAAGSRPPQHRRRLCRLLLQHLSSPCRQGRSGSPRWSISIP
jgi:hypothetical protein